VPKLTIGRVAAAAGVNVETIRYYQRRRLLEEPEKPLGGYRHYPAEMVKRIRFIKRAQSLGFTLEDVAGLLQLNDSDACTKTRQLAARKLTLIEQKIHEMATIRDALAELVDQCNKKFIEILQSDSAVGPSANRSSHHRIPSRNTGFSMSPGTASSHLLRTND
jgi:MerR family transcriptional regulator, mercuric resistance operon regulatory protein